MSRPKQRHTARSATAAGASAGVRPKSPAKSERPIRAEKRSKDLLVPGSRPTESSRARHHRRIRGSALTVSMTGAFASYLVAFALAGERTALIVFAGSVGLLLVVTTATVVFIASMEVSREQEIKTLVALIHKPRSEALPEEVSMGDEAFTVEAPGDSEWTRP